MVIGVEEIERGEIWWADLPEPRGSEPGFRRPILVIQADRFNRSRIRTLIVAIITGNLNLSDLPGNVLLPASVTGLNRDSVVNLSQVLTLDRGFFIERVGALPPKAQQAVDNGLRLVLAL